MNEEPVTGQRPSSISILVPDLRGGGAERVAVNLANSFAEQGYLVDMVLLSSKGELLADLRPEVRAVDLHAKRLRGALLPLVRYLRKAKPGALLACMWPLTVIAVWARILARARTRVIVAEHTTWSRSELLKRPTTGWQVRTSMRFTFPWAEGVVAVSHGAAADLARFSLLKDGNITVIYNPIVGKTEPPPATGPLAPADWWSGPHRRVLAVGTLKAVKNYGALLAAFALLRQRTDARLLILGEGETRGALETQARRLGIEKSVFMPGFIKDVRPYYEQAELLVLSSTAEGLPTVIIEALAAGTPVVSTDCPSGPREILRDGQFGGLVAVGDTVALAAAMERSLSTKHDSTALKARAQDFSIEKAANRYLELLLPKASEGSQT